MEVDNEMRVINKNAGMTSSKLVYIYNPNQMFKMTCSTSCSPITKRRCSSLTPACFTL